MFRRIDAWIIDELFQPLVDQYYRWRDRNNYGLAALLFTVTSCIDFAVALVIYKDVGTITLHDVIMPLIGISLAGDALKFERLHAKQSVFANPFRHSKVYLFCRLLGIAGSIYGLYLCATQENMKMLLITASGFMFCAAMYVEACSSKPPPKEVRERELAPVSVKT